MKNKALIVFFISIILLISISMVFAIRDNAVPISMQDAISISKTKMIQKILISDEYAYLHTNDEKIYKVKLDEFNMKELPLRIPLGVKNNFMIYILNNVVAIILSLIIIFSITIYLINKKMKDYNKKQLDKNTKKINDIKNEAKNYEIKNSMIDLNKIMQNTNKSTIKFSDVAGIKEAKDELIEIVDYLKNPQKYKDLSIQLPRGVLLVGPPGVGKTLIAKAVAGEANVPFFYQSGSSFVQMYVGIGAKRVRELFAKAKAAAPSIIFIDEIDALGKARGINGNDEREATLNELLSEMDGFEERSGIIVIAATNQIEVLDPALLRSGRFDRRIFIDLPDIFEREQIIDVYLKNKNHKLDSKEIAKMCVGFSGANLALLINEAALNAIRNNRKEIIMQDIIDTSEKIISGKKKQVSLNNDQKFSIAIYNAGKAISSYWLDDEFHKISLIGSHKIDSITHPSTKSDLLNKIKVCLSGNLALEINKLEISTIAQDDITSVKKIAKQMCEVYGMGEKIITDLKDVLELIENVKTEHRDFIISNKENIINIAHQLIEKEKLNKDEIGLIINNHYAKYQQLP